jgi:hypothetical protein
MEIIIISLLVALLFILLNDRTEKFTPNLSKTIDVKQCDFNDKNLSKRCKNIRDGCTRLKQEEVKMNQDMIKGCDNKKELKTVRETISSRMDCVTDVERLIRSKYAQGELCSQIKNMPNDMKKESSKDSNNSSSSEKMFPYDKKGSFSELNF